RQFATFGANIDTLLRHALREIARQRNRRTYDCALLSLAVVLLECRIRRRCHIGSAGAVSTAGAEGGGAAAAAGRRTSAHARLVRAERSGARVSDRRHPIGACAFARRRSATAA